MAGSRCRATLSSSSHFFLDIAARAGTAWVILLQNQGVVNQALLGLGVLDKPMRGHNRLGLYIAMVHVLALHGVAAL